MKLVRTCAIHHCKPSRSLTATCVRQAWKQILTPVETYHQSARLHENLNRSRTTWWGRPCTNVNGDIASDFWWFMRAAQKMFFYRSPSHFGIPLKDPSFLRWGTEFVREWVVCVANYELLLRWSRRFGLTNRILNTCMDWLEADLPDNKSREFVLVVCI